MDAVYTVRRFPFLHLLFFSVHRFPFFRFGGSIRAAFASSSTQIVGYMVDARSPFLGYARPARWKHDGRPRATHGLINCTLGTGPPTSNPSPTLTSLTRPISSTFLSFHAILAFFLLAIPRRRFDDRFPPRADDRSNVSFGRGGKVYMSIVERETSLESQCTRCIERGTKIEGEKRSRWTIRALA